VDPSENSVMNVSYFSQFKQIVEKLKKKDIQTYDRVVKQVEKIIKEPSIGKPLRYSLKNRRRVHVGHFVLVYEFYNNELRFLDFDHHDKIYKKY
jgi:mRNA-degrading endonuclease RelE of RelBE toxin-antitoxin system